MGRCDAVHAAHLSASRRCAARSSCSPSTRRIAPSGCTAELTKFRDQYRTLFGDGVVVLPISADSIPSHVSWASEAKFPFALVSDPQLATADLYGSHVAGRPVANRTVYVVGKDGRVAWREMKFNALNEDAYTALAAAVAKAR